jgi:CRP-like cAMP-binding protein
MLLRMAEIWRRMAEEKEQAKQERSVSNYRKNQKVFSQGDPADAVFYIQDGEVKVCVISEQGKEAVVALHGKRDSSARGVCWASRYAWRLLRL